MYKSFCTSKAIWSVKNVKNLLVFLYKNAPVLKEKALINYKCPRPQHTYICKSQFVELKESGGKYHPVLATHNNFGKP